MSEREPSGKAPRTSRPPRSDFGRRVAKRSQELGLTRDEVADRAGAAAGYIRYVQENPALPDVALLSRAAGALQTTGTELDAVVCRTAPGAAPASASGIKVAFEVDHIKKALSQGWSVLVVGMAHKVTGPENVGRLVAGAHSKPWAGGDREVRTRIEPEHITGRLTQVR